MWGAKGEAPATLSGGLEERLGRGGGGPGGPPPSGPLSLLTGPHSLPNSRLAAWAAFAAFGLFYLLFQKKALPYRYARLVAKLYFWPTIPLTIMSRWGNYWTVLDRTLIVGAAPLALLGHVDTLHNLGVTGVINLCDEYPGPIHLYQRYGIEQLHLPVVDHYEPNGKDLRRAIDFIRDKQGKGERVFVHCKAGHGRSAAVALCWMIYKNPGVPTEVLNQRLRSKRKVRKTLYKQPGVKQFSLDLLRGHGSGSRNYDDDDDDGGGVGRGETDYEQQNGYPKGD